MEGGDIVEFHISFAITFIKTVRWSLPKFFLPFTMDSLGKFISLSFYLCYLMHFGQAGRV